MRTPPCPNLSKLQNESVEHAPYPCWGPPDCRCRWRAAHPRYPEDRQWTCRPGTPKSLLVRRKFPTLPWRRSMSSTRKTSGHPSPAYNLSAAEAAEGATTPAAATEAAEVATEVAAVATGAAEVAAAVEVVAAVEAAGGGGSPLADGATEAADSSLSSVFATTYRATPATWRCCSLCASPQYACLCARPPVSRHRRLKV